MVLGLAGSDTLRAVATATVIVESGGSQFLAGGSRSDTYDVPAGTSAVIVGGSESANDRVSVPGFALSRDNANVLEVGGHLAVVDFETSSILIIVDWLSPARKIEEIVLEDAVIRVDAGGAGEVRGLEGYLGKLSWSELEELLASSSSFSKSDAAAFRDLVESVSARADASDKAASDILAVVADSPEANDDSFTVAAAGLGKRGALLDLLDNDVASTGSLRAKSLSIVDKPDNGSLSMKKGNLYYKPDAGFDGEDTFTYTVADKSGVASDAATVRIEVSQPDPPQAVADKFTLEAASLGKRGGLLDLLDNDIASTGSLRAKSLSIVDKPDNGSLSMKKGKLYYKPDAGFEGEDTFTYTVADKSGLASDAAVVRVVVSQPDPPQAVADSFTVDAASLGKKGALLDILVNDVASTGSLRAKSLRIVDEADNGSVTVKKGKLYYKPDAGFDGEDTFTYTVTDKSGLVSAEAVVRVEVEGVVLRAADLIDNGDLVVEPGSGGSFHEEKSARKSVEFESTSSDTVYVEGIVVSSWINEGEAG